MLMLGRPGARAHGVEAGTQKRAHGDVQLLKPRRGNGQRRGPQRRPFSAPSSTTTMLEKSVAEAEAERTRRRARGRARCCAAWRRGRSSGAGDGAGTGARRARATDSARRHRAQPREEHEWELRRASSFGACPRSQRAQEERARKSRAGGAGRGGLCVWLGENSGLHRACARRCSTFAPRVLVRLLSRRRALSSLLPRPAPKPRPHGARSICIAGSRRVQKEGAGAGLGLARGRR